MDALRSGARIHPDGQGSNPDGLKPGARSLCRPAAQARAAALMRVHTELQRAVLGGRGRAALRGCALPAAATLDAPRLLQLWDARGPPGPAVRAAH